VRTIKSHWLEIITVAFVFVFLLTAFANAQGKKGKQQGRTEINYTIEIVNGMDEMAGVNRHGEMAGNLRDRAVFVNRKDKSVEFECLQFDRPEIERYTLAYGINNDGTIVGRCASGTFGFVRRKGGHLYQFSVPGADQTGPTAMNDREDIVGEYITPFPDPNVSGWYRFKSFIRRSSDGRITTLSAPPLPDDVGAPHSLTRTVATGINNRGQVIGTYGTIFTPSNEMGLWGSFLYDNGQFTQLPKGLTPWAINNDGVIVAQKETGQFVVYDDGYVFTLALPAGYSLSWVNSINDLGQLSAHVREGVWPTLQFREVIATPVR
jgi:hypothetical protein